ncbi:MAG: DUF3810 family protein [Vicinamibacterales bacterium]
MRRLTVFCVLVTAAAIGVATLQAPGAVTAAYGTRVYPALQSVITPLSNRTRIPLFDVLMLGMGVALVTATILAARRAWKRRRFAPLLRVALVALAVASLGYLWFLAAWGQNYRRPGVEVSLDGFRPDRVTPAAVRALAERAVEEANRLHTPAHAQGFPDIDAVPADLATALHRVERRLGRPTPTVFATPKQPLTAPYMRAVGVSGMLAPLFLETYLNPDLTGPERPYVLAHEWAHLSGFAPEEDASFVGVLAALDADVASQYSAWLFLVLETARQLQRVTRDLVLAGLADGPRQDLEAIEFRQRSRVPWLDRASWIAYDRAIKSQGAETGVAGYGRVVQLLLGSGVLERKQAGW